MKRSLIVSVVLVTLLIPALCSANPPRPGPYVGGFIGASIPRDADVTGFDFFSDVPFDERVEFDPGINIGGSLGYDFGYVRLEGELAYKYSEISAITEKSNGLPFLDVDGNLGSFSGMANVFIDLHNPSPVTPYFGGGVGFAALTLSDTFGTDSVNGARIPLYLEDDDAVFAYQVGAGVGIELNPQLTLDLGYRYFGTSKANFGGDLPIATDMKFESHNATVGIRVKFY
jgi:opacity protein-like surface antigen